MHSSPPAPQVIAPRIRVNPWLALLTVTLGLFMILVDSTIVNVAIPNMEKGLNASFDQILWVVNAYLLIYAVLLIPASRLGDMFGPRRVYLIGIVVFALASLACALSQSAEQLIAFRVVQGVGGALMTPQSLSLIGAIFPPEKRGAAFGVWSSAAGVAIIVGPALGGFLTTVFDWPAIFLINGPIGVLALVAASLLVPEVRMHRRHSIDVIGMILIAASLVVGVYALIEAQRFAWGRITTLGSFSIGSTKWSVISVYSLLVYAVVLLALFIWYEGHVAEPLMPLSLFRDRNFAAGNAEMFIVMFAIFGFSLPFNIWMQSVLGWSAVHAGLTPLPQALAQVVVAPFAGRFSDRGKGKGILIFGFAMFAVGFGLIVRSLALDNTSWTYTIPLIIMGIGSGCVWSPLLTMSLKTITPAKTGAAAGVINTTRQVGGAVGSAVVGTVLANSVASNFVTQATRVAGQLPPAVRPHFVQGWRAASHGSQRFGIGQAAGGAPTGVPQELAQRIASLAHQVFSQAFLNGLRPTMLIPFAALALGALVATVMDGRQRTPAEVAADAPARVAEAEPA